MFTVNINTYTRNVEILPMSTKAAPRKPQQAMMAKARKAFKKWYNAQARKADKALRERFARFMVLDNYGTCQLTYTMRGAMEWLPYCAPDARIVCASSGSLLRKRTEHLD